MGSMLSQEIPCNFHESKNIREIPVIPGAMVGGIVIGLCECFVSAIGLSAWKDAVTFAILIIVLLFKPTGFLGRKVQEKV